MTDIDYNSVYITHTYTNGIITTTPEANPITSSIHPPPDRDSPVFNASGMNSVITK